MSILKMGKEHGGKVQSTFVKLLTAVYYQLSKKLVKLGQKERAGSGSSALGLEGPAGRLDGKPQLKNSSEMENPNPRIG